MSKADIKKLDVKALKEKGVKLLHEKSVPGGGGSMIAVISPEGTNDIITELVERE